jgi:hypothetical protein
MSGGEKWEAEVAAAFLAGKRLISSSFAGHVLIVNVSGVRTCAR